MLTAKLFLGGLGKSTPTWFKGLRLGWLAPIAVALVVILAANPVVAKQTYRCDMTANSQNGWISPLMILSYDDQSAQGEVENNYIHHTYGKPFPARFKRRNVNTIQLTWELTDIPLSNRRLEVTAKYSVILREQTGKITMTVYVQGADMNPPRGSGTCKKIK